MIGEGGGERVRRVRKERGKEEGRAGMKRYPVFAVKDFYMYCGQKYIVTHLLLISLSLFLSTCRRVLLMCVVQGLWRSWSPIANGSVSAVTRHL